MPFPGSKSQGIAKPVSTSPASPEGVPAAADSAADVRTDPVDFDAEDSANGLEPAQSQDGQAASAEQDDCTEREAVDVPLEEQPPGDGAENETQSSGNDEGSEKNPDGANVEAVAEACEDGETTEAPQSTQAGALEDNSPKTEVEEEIEEAEAKKLKVDAIADEPTPDQDKLQAERNRLKDLVHKFVARALAGAPCALLAEAGRTPTKYCIDSSLETFSLVSAQDLSHTLIACRIANIEDVYSVADDGSGPFPPPILAMLEDEELPTLLMLVFRGPQNRLYRFCILEETGKSCAIFMEAMSCLHMYAQPQADRLRRQVAEEHAKMHNNGAQGADPDGSLSRMASGAADAALSQQASVGFLLRCAGVRGGRGTLGALMCKAMKLSRQVTISPLPPKQVAGYLGAYGYAAQSATAWRITPALAGLGSRPRLDIAVTQHIEVSGHTWYMMECTMLLEGPLRHPRLIWQVPRRLAHLRQDLHDPVKAALGKSYHKHFSGSRFARAGGVPGTTAALHRWSNTLAHVLKSGSTQPALVALVLRFLEAPSPELPKDAVQ